MNDLERVPTREDVERLQKEISKHPQPVFETRHYFADGMYLRELPRPAGTTIIGKVHKKEHFYVVLSGEVTIVGEGRRERVKAPHIFVCKSGTKRAVYAHVDSVCMTVHRVTSHDLYEIEEELVESDPDSQYLPGNVRKVDALEQK